MSSSEPVNARLVNAHRQVVETTQAAEDATKMRQDIELKYKLQKAKENSEAADAASAACDRTLEARKKPSFAYLVPPPAAAAAAAVPPAAVPPVAPPPPAAAPPVAPPPADSTAPLQTDTVTQTTLAPEPLKAAETQAAVAPALAETVASTTLPPAESPSTPTTPTTPSTTPSKCLYVSFEAETFHLGNNKNTRDSGASGLRTIDDFMRRFVSGDEQTMKDVMCKYWSIKSLNKIPISKLDASGNKLADKMYRVPCAQSEINSLIKAFQRYEAFLESPTNKAELDTLQHFNPSAQIEYVKVYLQRLRDALSSPPKDCIGLHETITTTTTAGPSGSEGTNRYYGILPKVFYLLYNQSKTGQPLKAQELLNTYSTLTQDPDELLKTIYDDTDAHSDVFEPVPVSVLALMNLISEKFPHIYKLKMGTGTGAVTSDDAKKGEAEKEEEKEADNSEITSGLNVILSKIFGDDDDSKTRAMNNFIEAHQLYHKKNSKGAVDSINLALEEISKALKKQLEAAQVQTQKTEGTGTTAPPPQLVQAAPAAVPDTSDNAEKDAEIADLKAKLAKCAELDGKYKGCEDKIAALNTQIEALNKEKEGLTEQLKANPNPAAIGEIESKLKDVTGHLDGLQKELDAEKEVSKKCNDELSVVKTALEAEKARAAELEKKLTESAAATADKEGQIKILTEKIRVLEEQNGDTAELDRLKAELLAAQKSLKESQDQNTHLNDVAKELQATITGLEAERDTLKNKIAEMTKELEALRKTGNQSEADRQRIAELTKQLADATTSLAKLQKDKSDTESRLVKERDTLSGQIKEIKDKLALAENERGASEADLRSKLDNCEKSKAEIESRLTEQIKKLQAEKAIVEKELGDLKVKAATSDAMVASMKATISELNARIEGLNKQIAETQAELSAALANKGSSNKQSKDTIEQLTKQLSELRSTVAILTGERDKQSGEVGSLRAQSASQEEQMKEMEDEIDRLNNEYDKLKSELDTEKRNTGALNAKLAVLNAQIAKSNAEKDALNKRISELETALADTEALRAQAAKVDPLLEQVSNLNAQLVAAEQKTREADRLRQELTRLQAELEAARQTVKKCEEDKKVLEEKHKRDIQAILDALKTVMNPLGVQLEKMNPDLGNTESATVALDAVGSSSNMDGLQFNMRQAVDQLNKYLQGANSNYGKWKEEFEKVKSAKAIPQAIPAAAPRAIPQAIPQAPAAMARPAESAYIPPYKPLSYDLPPQAQPQAQPKAQVQQQVQQQVQAQKAPDQATGMTTNRGYYILYIIDTKTNAKGVIVISTALSSRATSSTESTINKAIDSMADCFKNPRKCVGIENSLGNISDRELLKLFVSGIKKRGYKMEYDGPYRTKEEAKSKILQAGGGKKDDVVYGPDSMKSLTEHQALWEDLKDSYDSLPAEYKKIVPKPGKSPLAHTLEPFSRYIDENEVNDPESINEAREALEMLSPEEVDEMIESDTETPAMERVKPYYGKALPKLKEEWLPVMIRADIVSRVMNEKMDDLL
jgi:predicted  nucleic acid-binding Zn-ribbon protein